MDEKKPRELLFHVSPTVNRASILSHGLDVSLMGAARGSAGSTKPEAQGTHLVDHFDETWWYASFRQHDRLDIWQVRTADLRLEEAQDGWLCRDDPTRSADTLEKGRHP